MIGPGGRSVASDVSRGYGAVRRPAGEETWPPRPRAFEVQLREGLARACGRLGKSGLVAPVLGGQLLRPALALRLIPPEMRDDLPDGFWLGCCAVQMVHEASLLHDDVIDGGQERRGRPTVVAEQGRGASLLLGDAMLTTAYVVADMAGGHGFMSRFVRAVEQTVHGEVMQWSGPADTPCGEITSRKTGALFGLAADLASRWGGTASPDEAWDLGVALGTLYQKVDDFLDYCPRAATGKPPLQDFHRGIRTWMVPPRFPGWFKQSERQLQAALFGDAPASLGRAHLESLEHQVEDWIGRAWSLGLDPLLAEMPRGWVARCRESLTKQEAQLLGGPSSRPTDVVSEASTSGIAESVEAAARAMGPPEAWPAIFAEGSRSFSFAARLFPAEARSRIAGIYAFCRFTDDLVDEASEGDLKALEYALDHWAYLCKRSHAGDPTGIALVDSVVSGMAERGVPLEYALELIEGVRMDVRPPVYASLDQLRLYTYRVASVVGGWMVRSFGIDDPWILDRAFALGHAMQLTNILRDVGEDLNRGRVYLPAELLRRHGLRVTDLEAMRAGGWIDSAYPGVLEELMTIADESYAAAFEGLASVPTFFARPVAAAASIYRGIHDRIRANGYDNLSLRAHTGTTDKIVLAVEGLMRLRRSRRAHAGLGLLVRGMPETR